MRSGADRMLLNGCRQSGKSTITALLAAHNAYYQPDSLVLLLSPSLRQSQELLLRSRLLKWAGEPSAPAGRAKDGADTWLGGR